MVVRVVIFDYKALLAQPGTAHAYSARAMLDWLHAQGIRWCIFSTDPFSEHQQQWFTQLGYPPASLRVDLSHIASGKRRGSPDWVDVVTQAFRLQRYELLYVGCTTLDWRTAINSGVLYLHANWAAAQPAGTTSLAVNSPTDVLHFVHTFLTSPPSWSHSWDDDRWRLRSLLPARASLPSTSPSERFTLQDVFTYDKAIKISNSDARDMLMLFVLTNAYAEGLIPAHPLICVYPSSKKGKVSSQLETYLDKAAKLFHGYYRDDLLVRAADAPGTSLERWRAKQGNRAADVSIATQAQTVHLGPTYRGKLTGKTVVVFDDFTTNGMSLEWARLLLAAAGAEWIVMLTLGKYGTGHTHYDLNSGITLVPFGINTLTSDAFSATPRQPVFNPAAEMNLCDKISNFITTSSSN